MSTLSEMIERTKRSVVQIWNPSRVFNGSGFVCDLRGFALTTEDAVDGRTNGWREPWYPSSKVTVVLSDGASSEGTVVGRDALSELAVVRFESGTPLTALGLEDLGDICIGEEVVTMGYPWWGRDVVPEFIAVRGLVSDVGDRNNLHDLRSRYIEYTHSSNDLNMAIKGGPIIDLHGRLVGINRWNSGFILPPPKEIGNATSSDLLKLLLPLLMDGYCSSTETVFLNAKTKHQISLNLLGGTKIRYFFEVLDYKKKQDVTYRILDSEGRIMASRTKVRFDTGAVAVPYSGVYKFELDNSFSWFKDKIISLLYELIPTGFEPLELGNRFRVLANPIRS